MRILSIVTLLIFCSNVFSQTNEIEFGQISIDELKMAEYEKDTEAKAVILFDKGKSIFFDTDNGYDIRFTRHKRVKIFDKSESQHAEISIPFYKNGFGKTEEVTTIEAITYNLKDGKIIQKRLNPQTIYEEKINDRWYTKKFVFPDVQNGSVLDLKYVLETPFHFNLPDWTFQDKIPTVYSEYEVEMIPFYEYVFLAQGISKFDYQKSVVSDYTRTWGQVAKSYGKNIGTGIEFQDYIHTYVLKDIPAFKDESYITSLNDYIIKMDMQLAKFHSPRGGSSEIISTWQKLNESLLKNENFGKYLKESSRFAKRIIEDELELEGLDQLSKAKKIIQYVKNSFEWNGFYGKYSSQSAKEFINKKSGNSADINLFLISILNEADITTEPIILSTRKHGKIKTDYPFDHFTNYVIAYVMTDTPFLADGTEEYLPFNKIPARCFNEMGLVVNKDDQSKWISLKNNISSLERNILALTIDTTSLDIYARVSIQSTEYESYANRSEFQDDTVKIKEYYSEKLGEINRIKTFGYKNASAPYSINFESTYETEKIGNNIVIRPLLHLPLSKNKLTQKKRAYPVDFVYPWEQQFESTLVIPEGLKLTDLPESYNLDNDLADVNINYTVMNNNVSVNGHYKFKKAIYVSNEYARIKFYLDQIVKYFNQPVVLEKID